MSLSASLVALNSSTATAINSVSTVTDPVTGEQQYSWQTSTITIQNVDASATVYLGTSGVTSTAYGYKLAAGTSLTLEFVSPEDIIYGISTGSSKVALLALTK